MDYKQGYIWLSRARTLDFQIRDKIEYIESLYSCCGIQGICYDKVSVVISPENKFERIMADIDKEKRELEDLRVRKESAIREISEKINTLNPSPEKTVLMAYFIGCRDMKKISEDLKYDFKYCYELRKKGIRKL